MIKKIKRTLIDTLAIANQQFKVVLVTGPRQVGKTTLLQAGQDKQRSYVTLDNLSVRAAAQQDPESFIARLALPTLIDEVQYAPELFPYIKIAVDELQQNGLFWLTGSQQFEMMKNVTESLAGRVAILNLSGISLAEEQGRTDNPPFLPEPELLKRRQKGMQPINLPQLYEKIWRGTYPEMVVKKDRNWELFYESYVSTYIQRDIREILDIQNLNTFHRFMQIAATRTGQLINYNDMARDIGITAATVKSWLQILQASGIIYLLRPYFNNRSKRLIKTSKLYFMDTGLCTFLSGWLTPTVLERGAMSGAILETYVVSEIIKSYWHCGLKPPIYFYRDKEKNEIDMLIERNGKLYPLEIKKTAMVDKRHCSNFHCLDNLGVPIGHGGVLCLTSCLLPLTKNVDAIPISCL